MARSPDFRAHPDPRPQALISQLNAALRGQWRRRVTCQQCGIDVGLQSRSRKRHVGDRAIFDDLRQTRRSIRAAGKVLKCVQVTHHTLRLVERADHVLAQRVVDGCLPAHGRIHLCQQGGWAPGRTARRACSLPPRKPLMSPTTPPPSATRSPSCGRIRGTAGWSKIEVQRLPGLVLLHRRAARTVLDGAKVPTGQLPCCRRWRIQR